MSSGVVPQRAEDLTAAQRRCYDALRFDVWYPCSSIAEAIRPKGKFKPVYLTAVARVCNLLAKGPLVERSPYVGRTFKYRLRAP